jgi:filamentous hemagglutinin family protein
MKHLLLGAAVSSALAAPALAQTASNTLPSGGQVDAGSATISTPSAGSMQIDQSSGRAIINWQSFSIGSGASVRFNQPGVSSVVLNRVLGGSPSEIFGRLSSNGQVFLTNPNGVLFAPGASVEVGALFATTLSIGNDDFMAGRYAFANHGGAGAVVNRGSILTPNGYTALAAPQVRNEGLIVAQLGTVALAAGDRVTLNMVEGSLIGVSVDQAALNASILNSGTLQANGGRVILTASSANALLDTVINNTGTIRANRLEERDGQIVLNGGPTGIVRSSGILEADTMILDGGQVDVTIGTPGLPTAPAPVIGPNPPVRIADPNILRIPTASTRAIFAGSFSISASAAVSFVQPSLPPTTTLLSVSPGGGTIQPLTGVITITGTSGQVGLLPPLPVTVLGAGVLVPPQGLTTVP